MRRSWRRRAAAALLTASFALPSPARAENADTTVEVRTCEASDAMVSAMRVELAATATPIAKLTVVCFTGARVLVVAFPKGIDRPAALEVDVADAAPDARTRSVAIATGELLRSLGAGTPVSTPQPAVAATVPTPVPAHATPPIVVQVTPPQGSVAPHPRERGQAPDASPFGWSLGASLHTRVFPMASTAIAGPALELDAAIGQLPLRLRIASDLGFARDALPAGETSLIAWTGSVALLARARAGTFFFDAGPFIEGGAAFAEGSVPTGDAVLASGSSPIALVGGEAIVGARFGSFAVPFLAVDAGGVLGGIEANVDDRVALALRGLFVGARVGFAIAP